MARRYVWTVIAVAVGVSVLAVADGWLLLPMPNSCEKTDPELDRLTASAGRGDMEAISVLFAQAKRDGVQPMQEHWALEGGLRGNRALRQAFVDYFNGMRMDHQQRVVAQIKLRSAMLGAPCLLRALGDSSVVAQACNGEAN
jgi:hypothetical protein